MGYLYILATVLFTVFGQIIIKMRIPSYGEIPQGNYLKIIFILKLLLDPYIISGFLASFIAAITWMAAITKFELSFAYPFMSLNFILIFLFSIFLFGESFTLGKLIGLIFIIMGIFVTVKY